jgi:hypothetical protein
MMILIAGPYRSGTNDDPLRIAQNVENMAQTALLVYEMGHLPILGEWIALPLIETAGSERVGDNIFNKIFHPSAIRLISHCDAVLRIGGPSHGADDMVKVGLEKGKQIFYDLGDISII